MVKMRARRNDPHGKAPPIPETGRLRDVGQASHRTPSGHPVSRPLARRGAVRPPSCPDGAVP